MFFRNSVKFLYNGSSSMLLKNLISNYSRGFRSNALLYNQPTEDLSPLKLADEIYAIFRVHNRPYLVTEGDKVTLPFKVKQAEVGDVLSFNDVTTIGSRNYKLMDYPIDPSLYTLKATIIEKTKRAFQVREVTKRRNRKVRHATSKGDLTILRISELKVN